MWVAAQTDIQTFHRTCFDDSNAKCKLVVTTTVPAHYVLPDASGLPLLTTARRDGP
jgi:hypothetical protein